MLVLFNKPYGVLTQFTDPLGRPTLADYISTPNIYAAGRLDTDSEGLLVLTDDVKLRTRIMSPKFKLPKSYWVQVEGIPTDEALKQLKNGVLLKDGMTKTARVQLIEPPAIWDRNPPIRYRATIPTSWLSITITEGKNRQVRRMTAAVGFPTLRLIRFAVGQWRLSGLEPGQWKIVTQ